MRPEAELHEVGEGGGPQSKRKPNMSAVNTINLLSRVDNLHVASGFRIVDAVHPIRAALQHALADKSQVLVERQLALPVFMEHRHFQNVFEPSWMGGSDVTCLCRGP